TSTTLVPAPVTRATRSVIGLMAMSSPFDFAKARGLTNEATLAPATPASAVFRNCLRPFVAFDIALTYRCFARVNSSLFSLAGQRSDTDPAATRKCVLLGNIGPWGEQRTCHEMCCSAR